MSGPFREVQPGFRFPELEERVLELWRRTQAFEQSVARRRGRPPFVFLEGPPTANGKPGVHHVLSRVMKDIVCRYKTMRGYYVERKAGWDTHGLPVEIEVERELGISGKKEIESFGIQRFVERCKESVFRYEKEWRRTTERIGFWLDMDHPYITLTNDYIESVWYVLRRFWDAGLLYQGHKVVPYCPRCGTALSSHEVAQGYRTVADPSVIVQFPVRGEENTFFLVWTTTPWTLPSNVALAVAPDAEYVRVRDGQRVWILARRLLEAVLGDRPVEVLDAFTGRDLAGTEYEPLFQFVQPDKRGWYVVTADFVSLDEGTGIVHMAPAFGQDDYEVGQQYDLPFLQLVDPEGRFVPAVRPWAGRFVKDADPDIIADLRERGLLFRAEQYEHEYPFCWRCDTPLLYYARSSWFIRTTAYKDRMVELNQRVNWYPEHLKEGRFGDWLRNNVDWAVSRERYWGTPLPIWICQACGHQHCIGSAAELRAMAKEVPPALEFHRPYIDAVELICPQCQGTMRRIPEVADAWLDSGCAHTAQWHAPFENQDKLQQTYPADFISEAIDQTRGWFYSLLATGAFLYDQEAYRNVLCLELVLGADGQKMSKSRGNAVDPWVVLDRYGADAIRWYFYTVAPPWQRRIFSEEAVADSMKRFLGTLYNVYGFLTLYANAEEIDPREDPPPVAERPVLDRWILSRLHGTIETVRGEMDHYQITPAARAIESFVDDLSNWYVRRSRERFWGTEDRIQTRAAFATLYEVLTTLAPLMAPFVPFLAEEMYQNLVRSLDPEAPESVHWLDYPEPDSALVDRQLETAMELAREVVRLGRAARNESRLRTRQPLPRMVVGGLSVDQQAAVKPLLPIIQDELNVRAVEWGERMEDFAQYTAKANFRTLGPKYGKAVQAIARAISASDAAQLHQELARSGTANVVTELGTFPVERDDVILRLEPQEGYAVAVEGDLFVALDVRLTPELVREGLARELINRYQQMRKEAGFHVTDRIAITPPATGQLREAFDALRDLIMRETLAVQVEEPPDETAFVQQMRIAGETVTLAVRRVKEGR